MPKAIVNPDEVRRFAAFLETTAATLRHRKSAVSSGSTSLRAVWRDQKYAQFERVLSESMSGLDRFLKYAEDYAQYLRKKAEKVDRYLKQRY